MCRVRTQVLGLAMLIPQRAECGPDAAMRKHSPIERHPDQILIVEMGGM